MYCTFSPCELLLQGTRKFFAGRMPSGYRHSQLTEQVQFRHTAQFRRLLAKWQSSCRIRFRLTALVKRTAVEIYTPDGVQHRVHMFSKLRHFLFLVPHRLWVPGFGSRRCKRFFSSPWRPDRLWSPPNLLSNEYQGSFPLGKVAGAWSWLLTFIYCQGQLRRYISTSHTPLWHGA
jgi:hypothetical protein